MNVNFNAFTTEAQKMAQEVVNIASQYGQNHLDIEHVMLALLRVPDEELIMIFDQLGIDIDLFRNEFEFIVSKLLKGDKYRIEANQFTIDRRMKMIIEQAQYEANRLSVKDIKPVHLLLAAVEMYLGSEKKTAGGKIVAEIGITPQGIRKIIY